jgi:hypothetical protein
LTQKGTFGIEINETIFTPLKTLITLHMHQMRCFHAPLCARNQPTYFQTPLLFHSQEICPHFAFPRFSASIIRVCKSVRVAKGAKWRKCTRRRRNGGLDLAARVTARADHQPPPNAQNFSPESGHSQFFYSIYV